MARPDFQYSPLDYNTDVIRLVRLVKGFDDDPIRCDLFEALLHQTEGVSYAALSYTWSSSLVPTRRKSQYYAHHASSSGPANNPRYNDIGLLQAFEASYSNEGRNVDITVRGQTMKVGQNLYRALRCLRQPNQDTIWWIDAICIDQSNDLEKGHQVRQMGRIYDKAETVHIWLGPSSPDIDLLMDQMIQLDKRVIKRADYRRRSPDAWLREWPLLVQNMEVAGANKSFNTRRRNALVELLGRPWFERVWILQEVFNATTAVIRCGKKAIPTRTFVMMPRLLHVEVDPHIQAVLDIMPGYLREASWWRSRPKLCTLLEKFYDSVAKDKRDKIYALLGMASDTASHEILRPDSYQVSLSKTIKVTVHYLLFGQVVNDPMFELPDWSFRDLPPDIGSLPGSVLFWALENRFERTAIEVINRTSIDINKPMIAGKPVPLVYLAEQNHLTTVMEALLSRNDVDLHVRRESDRETPLSIAANRGNVNMMRLLLGHPDTDQHLMYYGRTPLELAAKTGDVALFELVLARFGPQHRSFKWDIWRSPLVVAAKQGWKQQLQDISEKHNILERVAYNTALYAAAENGHFEAVEFLLDQGADMNALISTNKTALRVAASRNQLEVVKLLLARGAMSDPSVAIRAESEPQPTKLLLKEPNGAVSYDVNLSTSLLQACGDGHLGVAKSLLDAGANVNAVISDSVGRSTSALWMACKNGQVAVVEHLCRNTKAQVNPAFERYEPSPLWIACCGQNPEVVDLLLEHGADVNVHAEYYPEFIYGLRSALWMSRRTGHPRISPRLVRAGAEDKILSTFSDDDALWLAAMKYRDFAVETFLHEGRNIETRDRHGRSLLWMAAYVGNPGVVSTLVRKGANLKALGATKGLELCTPEVAARERKHYEVVKILELAAADRDLDLMVKER